MKEGAHSAVMGVKGSRAKRWPWDQLSLHLQLGMERCMSEQSGIFHSVFFAKEKNQPGR